MNLIITLFLIKTSCDLLFLKFKNERSNCNFLLQELRLINFLYKVKAIK